MTFAQLREAGFSRRQIQVAVRSGRLRRLFRGVFLVGQFALPHTAEMAAVLACGPLAVLSHTTAARLYGMLGVREPSLHLTVASRHLRGCTGLTLHETATLSRHEVREREGIPVTAPARTLVDIAATCSAEDLEAAVAEAFALRLTNARSLLRATEAYRGRRGVARLTALLDGHPPARTRSDPERVLLRGIRAAGLPEPETNVKVGRWEVDFLWREVRLAVEVDAYSTHSSPRAFDRDRRKDADLATTGLRVQRFTADQVRDELDRVIAWIAARFGVPPSL